MRFPRMHIAASVQNRLLNLADRIAVSPAAMTLPPPMPNTAAQGAQLDAALQAPANPAASAPEGAELEAMLAARDGSGVLDALATTALLGDEAG